MRLVRDIVTYHGDRKMTLAHGCVTPCRRNGARDMTMLDAASAGPSTGWTIRRTRVTQLPDSPLGTDLASLIQKADSERAIADPGPGARLSLLLARLAAIDKSCSLA